MVSHFLINKNRCIQNYFKILLTYHLYSYGSGHKVVCGSSIIKIIVWFIKKKNSLEKSEVDCKPILKILDIKGNKQSIKIISTLYIELIYELMVFNLYSAYNKCTTLFFKTALFEILLYHFKNYQSK